MTTRDFLTGLALYVGACALGWFWVCASRPSCCPRGHTDLYNLCGWRCRVCDRRAREGRVRG